MAGGRPRLIQNVMAPIKSNTNFSDGAKSKGILDDFAVRKDIQAVTGKVSTRPVEENDIVNKKYVDDLSIGTYLDLYAYDDDSDVGTYKELKLTPSTGIEVESSVSVLGNAVMQAIGARISEDTIDIPAQINSFITPVPTNPLAPVTNTFIIYCPYKYLWVPKYVQML